MDKFKYSIDYDLYYNQFVINNEDTPTYNITPEKNTTKHQLLLQIQHEWLIDFKSELFKNWNSSDETISEFINFLINETLPKLIEDNPNNSNIYIKYLCRLKALNLNKC